MMRMQREVLIAGEGMVPFTKPSANAAYDETGEQPIRPALEDAAPPRR